MTHYGMTPDDYRAKWGLPADYPMVAPVYAERRRVLAKQIGLGTKAPRGGRKPAAKPAAKAAPPRGRAKPGACQDIARRRSPGHARPLSRKRRTRFRRCHRYITTFFSPGVARESGV